MTGTFCNQFRKMKIFVYLLVALLTASFVELVELPDAYPKCNQITSEEELPEFERCVVKSALAWKPILLEGIPVLGFPPLRQFIIPKASVKQKARAFAFDVSFLNVSVEGIELYQFKKYSYDLKSKTHYVIMEFPRLEAEGKFDMIGHFLGEKIQQVGNFTGQARNTLVDLKLFTKVVKRNGREFLQIKDSQIDIKIGKASGSFGNLFGSIEILNRAINQFLSESTDVVFEAAKPDIIRTLKKLISSTVNKIVDNIPLDSIFPTKSN